MFEVPGIHIDSQAMKSTVAQAASLLYRRLAVGPGSILQFGSKGFYRARSMLGVRRSMFDVPGIHINSQAMKSTVAQAASLLYRRLPVGPGSILQLVPKGFSRAPSSRV